MNITIPRDEPYCINCERFRLHYIQDSEIFGGGYVPISMGHCIHPRVKNRRVTDSCELFTAKESDANRSPSPE